MRLSRPSLGECGATHERISLELDDRLSGLDRAYLRAHLDGCADCRSYQTSVLAATRMLRADELEQPGFSIVVPRRRRVPVGALQATACAAAIALVTTLASFAAVGPVGHSATPRNSGSGEQRAFLVRHGKFVPAGNHIRPRRPTAARIAL
jgi:hypothetical protein